MKKLRLEQQNKYLSLKNISKYLFLLLLFACENDIQTINLLTTIDSLPVESAKHIELIYSDSGKVQAILESPLMNRYLKKEPYWEFPDGLKIVFYDSIMSVKSQLTANYGISYENRKILEAKNDVVVINNEKNERLNTEHLIWDQKKGIIYSDVFVKITTEDETLYGEGLESDEKFDSYTIKNPTGEFKIKQDEE
ncbi:MAG: LPS export ABC transporter periplasmic protein LptC [Bacteroidales bacterium]|nr:LPS export ABC transporter periplasmic protein LptC [Bacteroidales bacterium]